MSTTRRPGTLITFLLLPMLIAGCGLKEEQETRYYVINASPGLQALQSVSDSVVEITALNLPQYLERTQIVTRPSPQRLQIDEFNRWGGNLRKNLSRAMARNLATLLGTPNVHVVPHLARGSVDFRVHLNVAQFEAVEGRSVVLLADWTIVRASDNRTVSTQQVSLARELPPDAGMDQVVAAMEGVYGELSDAIARGLLAGKGG